MPIMLKMNRICMMTVVTDYLEAHSCNLEKNRVSTLEGANSKHSFSTTSKVVDRYIYIERSIYLYIDIYVYIIYLCFYK